MNSNFQGSRHLNDQRNAGSKENSLAFNSVGVIVISLPIFLFNFLQCVNIRDWTQMTFLLCLVPNKVNFIHWLDLFVNQLIYILKIALINWSFLGDARKIFLGSSEVKLVFANDKDSSCSQTLLHQWKNSKLKASNSSLVILCCVVQRCGPSSKHPYSK